MDLAFILSIEELYPVHIINIKNLYIKTNYLFFHINFKIWTD